MLDSNASVPLPDRSAAQSRLTVIMFTDLLDSTDMARRLGDAAYISTVLGPHNVLFRGLLSQFPESREVKHTGDGFFATFSSSSDAANCALRFHEALRTATWKHSHPQTRIGIHIGETVEFTGTDPGRTDLGGDAANITARVMSLASGGQTLMTRTAFDNARQSGRVHHPVVPTSEGDSEGLPRLQWLAHGRFRFKGSDEPLEVFEVGIPGLSPLSKPIKSDKAWSVASEDEQETLGWRPSPGEEVLGKPDWELIEPIGQGGFGEVWVAHHRRTREKRAFKFCFDPDRLRSLKRELTFFRLLRDHLGERPDIARLLEVQVDRWPFYLESEYVEGGNLKDWSDRQGGLGKLPLATRFKLLIDTARALAAAHSLGIIHKDLKPSNILIVEQPDGAPQPRLCDFGIGILTDRNILQQHGITETGFTESLMLGNDSSRTGTRLYSPPESLLNRPATTAGDVYALGVMLYQFVVGALDRPLATGWQEDVSDELLKEDIILCTHGDPARRLASPADLAERLENLDTRRDELVAQHRIVLQAQRLRRLKAIAATSLVALTFIGGLALFSYHQWTLATDLAESNGELAAKADSLLVKESEQRQRASNLADRNQQLADAAQQSALASMQQTAELQLTQIRAGIAAGGSRRNEDILKLIQASATLSSEAAHMCDQLRSQNALTTQKHRAFWDQHLDQLRDEAVDRMCQLRLERVGTLDLPMDPAQPQHGMYSPLVAVSMDGQQVAVVDGLTWNSQAKPQLRIMNRSGVVKHLLPVPHSTERLISPSDESRRQLTFQADGMLQLVFPQGEVTWNTATGAIVSQKDPAAQRFPPRASDADRTAQNALFEAKLEFTEEPSSNSERLIVTPRAGGAGRTIWQDKAVGHSDGLPNSLFDGSAEQKQSRVAFGTHPQELYVIRENQLILFDAGNARRVFADLNLYSGGSPGSSFVAALPFQGGLATLELLRQPINRGELNRAAKWQVGFWDVNLPVISPQSLDTSDIVTSLSSAGERLVTGSSTGMLRFWRRQEPTWQVGLSNHHNGGWYSAGVTVWGGRGVDCITDGDHHRLLVTHTDDSPRSAGSRMSRETLTWHEICDFGAGEPLRQYSPKGTDQIVSMTGNYAVVVRADGDQQKLQLESLIDGRVLAELDRQLTKPRLGSSEPGKRVLFSETSEWLVYGREKSYDIWHVPTGTKRGSIDAESTRGWNLNGINRLYGVHFDEPHGRLFIEDRGEGKSSLDIRMVQLADATVLSTLGGVEISGVDGQDVVVRMTVAGDLAVGSVIKQRFGGDDQLFEARLWNLRDGTSQILGTARWRSLRVQYNSSGTRAVLYGQQGGDRFGQNAKLRIELWDLKEPKRLREDAASQIPGGFDGGSEVSVDILTTDETVHFLQDVVTYEAAPPSVDLRKADFREKLSFAADPKNWRNWKWADGRDASGLFGAEERFRSIASKGLLGNFETTDSQAHNTTWLLSDTDQGVAVRSFMSTQQVFDDRGFGGSQVVSRIVPREKPTAVVLEHTAGDLSKNGQFQVDAGGQFIHSLNGDAWTNVWDARTGKRIIHFPQPLKGVVIDESKHWCFGFPLNQSELQIWDLTSGTRRHQCELSWLQWPHAQMVLIHPDGDKFTIRDRGTLYLWDAKENRSIRQFPRTGHSSPLAAVACSEFSEVVASLDTSGSLLLWEAETGGFRGNLIVPERSSLLAMSADGLAIVVADPTGRLHLASPDGVWRWHWQNPDLRISPLAPITALAFHPVGAILAAADSNGLVAFLDVRSGSLLGSFPSRVGSGKSACFSADGTRFAICGADAKVEIWETTSFQPIRQWQFDSTIIGVAFSADGRQLLIAARDLEIFDVETAKRTLLVPAPTPPLTGISTAEGDVYLLDSRNTVSRWNLGTFDAALESLQLGPMSSPIPKPVLPSGEQQTNERWQRWIEQLRDEYPSENSSI